MVCCCNGDLSWFVPFIIGLCVHLCDSAMWNRANPCSRILPTSPPPLYREWHRHSSASRWLEDRDGSHPAPPALLDARSSVLGSGSLNFSRDSFHQPGNLIDPLQAPTYSGNPPGRVNVNVDSGRSAACDHSCRDPLLSTWNRDCGASARDWLDGPSVGRVLDRAPEPSGFSGSRRRSSSVLQFQYNANASMRLEREPLPPARPQEEYYMVRQFEADLASDSVLYRSHLANKLSDPLRLRNPLTERDPHQVNYVCERSFQRLGRLSMLNFDQTIMNSMNYIHPSEYLVDRGVGGLVPNPQLDLSGPYDLHTRLNPPLSQSRPSGLPTGPLTLQPLRDGVGISGTCLSPASSVLPLSATLQQERCGSSIPLDLSRVTARDYLDPPEPLSMRSRLPPGKTADAAESFGSWGSATMARLESHDHHDTDSHRGARSNERRNGSLSSSVAAHSSTRRSCEENWSPGSPSTSSAANSSVKRSSGEVSNSWNPSGSTAAKSSMRRTSDEILNLSNPSACTSANSSLRRTSDEISRSVTVSASISTAASSTRRSFDENWDPWSRNENWDPRKRHQGKGKESYQQPPQVSEEPPLSTARMEAGIFFKPTSVSDCLEAGRHFQTDVCSTPMPNALRRSGGDDADGACGVVSTIRTGQDGSSSENSWDDSLHVTSASTEGQSSEIPATAGTDAGPRFPLPLGTNNDKRRSEMPRSSQSLMSQAASPESVVACTGSESPNQPPLCSNEGKDSVQMSPDLPETEGRQKRNSKRSAEEVFFPGDMEGDRSCKKPSKHSLSVSQSKDQVSPSVPSVRSSQRLGKLARHKSVELNANLSPTVTSAPATDFQSPYDLRSKKQSSITPEANKRHKVDKDETRASSKSLIVNLFSCKATDSAMNPQFPYDLRNKSLTSSTPETRKRHGVCSYCDSWHEAKSCSKTSKKKCQKSKTSSESDPMEGEEETETPAQVCSQQGVTEVDNGSVDLDKVPTSQPSDQKIFSTPTLGTSEKTSQEMQAVSELEETNPPNADVTDESRDGACDETEKDSAKEKSPAVSPECSPHPTKQDLPFMNSMPSSRGETVKGHVDSSKNSVPEVRNPFYTRYTLPVTSPAVMPYPSGNSPRSGLSQFALRSDSFRDAMYISYKDYQVGGHRHVLNKTGESLAMNVPTRYDQALVGSAKMRELEKIVELQKLAKLAQMQKRSQSAQMQKVAEAAQLQGRKQAEANLSGRGSTGVSQAQSPDSESSDDWDEDQRRTDKLFIDEGNSATNTNDAETPPAVSVYEANSMDTDESAEDWEESVVQSPVPGSETSASQKMPQDTTANFMSEKKGGQEKTAEGEPEEMGEERMLKKRVPLLLSAIKAIKSLQPVVSMVRISPEDMKFLNILDNNGAKADTGGTKAKSSSLKQSTCRPSSQTNGSSRELSTVATELKKGPPGISSQNWMIARPRQKRKVDYDVVDTSEESALLRDSDTTQAMVNLPDVIIPRKVGKSLKRNQSETPCGDFALGSSAAMDREISQMARGGLQLASQLGENVQTSSASGESFLTVNTGSTGATILVPMPPQLRKNTGSKRPRSRKAPLRSAVVTTAKSPGTGLYLCVYSCEFRCDSKLELSNHVIKEHRYRCGRCRLALPDKATLQVHRLQQHLSELHFCPLCSKHFLSAGFYKNHIKGAQHQMLLRVQQATLNTVISLGQQSANNSVTQAASCQGAGGDGTTAGPQDSEKSLLQQPGGGAVQSGPTEDVTGVDGPDLPFDIDLLDMDLLSIDLTNSPSPHQQSASTVPASGSKAQTPLKVGEKGDDLDDAGNLQAEEAKHEQTEEMQHQQCVGGSYQQPADGQFLQSSEGLYAQRSDGSHLQTFCGPYQQSPGGSHQQSESAQYLQSSNRVNEQSSGAGYEQSIDALYRQSMNVYQQSGDPSFQNPCDQQYRASSHQQNQASSNQQYQASSHQQHQASSHQQHQASSHQQHQASSHQQYPASSHQQYQASSNQQYPASSHQQHQASSNQQYPASSHQQYQASSHQQHPASSHQQHRQSASMSYQQPTDTQYEWRLTDATSQSPDAASYYSGQSNMMAPPQNPGYGYQSPHQSSSASHTYASLGSVGHQNDFTATASPLPSTLGNAGSSNKSETFIPMTPSKEGFMAEDSFLGMLSAAPPPQQLQQPQQLTPGAGSGGGPRLDVGTGQMTPDCRANCDQEKDSSDPRALKAKLDKLLMEIADDIYGGDSAMW